MKRILFLILIALLFVTPAFPDDLEFALNTCVSKVTGENTNEINFGEYSNLYGQINGKSRLEWDIDNILLTLGLQGTYNDTFVLSFDYTTSVESGNGTVRDRDWFYNSLINYFYEPLMGDTISDTESSANIYDLRFKWVSVPISSNKNIRVASSVGYLNQKWDGYEAKNIVGFYSGLLGDENINEQSGTIYATYEVEYKIPYIGVEADLYFQDKFLLNIIMDYSPIVEANAIDDHLEVGKVSEDETNGSFYSIKGEFAWKITKSMSLIFEASFLKIDTDGKEKQTFYSSSSVESGTIIGDIKSKLLSEQSKYGLKCSYKF